MKIYLSLLSLLLVLPAFGQDWYPWHSGGEYYYSAAKKHQLPAVIL